MSILIDIKAEYQVAVLEKIAIQQINYDDINILPSKEEVDKFLNTVLSLIDFSKFEVSDYHTSDDNSGYFYAYAKQGDKIVQEPNVRVRIANHVSVARRDDASDNDNNNLIDENQKGYLKHNGTRLIRVAISYKEAPILSAPDAYEICTSLSDAEAKIKKLFEVAYKDLIQNATEYRNQEQMVVKTSSRLIRQDNPLDYIEKNVIYLLNREFDDEFICNYIKMSNDKVLRIDIEDNDHYGWECTLTINPNLFSMDNIGYLDWCVDKCTQKIISAFSNIEDW